MIKCKSITTEFQERARNCKNVLDTCSEQKDWILVNNDEKV